jgi:hypothetical protein
VRVGVDAASVILAILDVSVILDVLATLNAFDALAALKASLESVAVSGTLDAFLGDVKSYSDVRTCSDIDLPGKLNCISYQTG